jgi:RNA polymerase sigma-70 factor, ECF subfamily
MQDAMEARTLNGIEEVYRAEAPKLWQSLVAFTHDADIASDAVAEAFAQVIARSDAVLDPARWVWRVAYRIAAGELQRRALHRGDEDVPDEGSQTRDWDADLMTALSRLPDRQRAAIVMHYLADLPTSHIATALDITPTTVRVLLLQGRRRLRALLGGLDERPS